MLSEAKLTFAQAGETTLSMQTGAHDLNYFKLK